MAPFYMRYYHTRVLCTARSFVLFCTPDPNPNPNPNPHPHPNPNPNYRIFGRERTSQGEVLEHTTLGVDFLIDAPTPGEAPRGLTLTLTLQTVLIDAPTPGEAPLTLTLTRTLRLP